MGQTREQKIIKQIDGVPTTQKFTPIATDMFLPNHSGKHVNLKADTLKITNKGDGDTLIYFDTDRAWSIKNRGTGSSSMPEISMSANKDLYFKSSSSTWGDLLDIQAQDTGATRPLIKMMPDNRTNSTYPNNCLWIDQDGDFTSIYIDSEATTRSGIKIDMLSGKSAIETNGQINLSQTAQGVFIDGDTTARSPIFEIKTRGDWATFVSHGSKNTDARLGEFMFYDDNGIAAGDGGTFNCDWTGSTYEWHFDITEDAVGKRCFSANYTDAVFAGNVNAGGDVIAGSGTGTAKYVCNSYDGITQIVPLAPNTIIGETTAGSLTFEGGILVGYVPAS